MKEEWQRISLWAELERVYGRLLRTDENAETDALISEAMRAARPSPAELAAVSERVVPVAKLREIFALSEFETDVLLLCAGAAIDRRFNTALAALQPDTPAPTLGLAASVLERPHWSALSRMRPLRYWRLVEIGPGPLLQAPLSIDERILQCLLGVRGSDDRLELVVHAVSDSEQQAGDASQQLTEVAMRGALHWRRAAPGALLLTGDRSSERTLLFHAMRRGAGLDAWLLEAGDLPEAAADREQLARAYTREAALWPAALLGAHRATGKRGSARGMAAAGECARGSGCGNGIGRRKVERIAPRGAFDEGCRAQGAVANAPRADCLAG
jgi:hypothetical protein